MMNKQIPGSEAPYVGSEPELADTFGGLETFVQPEGLIKQPGAQELAERAGAVRKQR
jgi:hypothetical protein